MHCYVRTSGRLLKPHPPSLTILAFSLFQWQQPVPPTGEVGLTPTRQSGRDTVRTIPIPWTSGDVEGVRAVLLGKGIATSISQTLHGTGIFAYIGVVSGANVGIYTRTLQGVSIYSPLAVKGCA